MAVYTVAPVSQLPKEDARAYFTPIEGNNEETIGYTFECPGCPIVTLDTRRCPTNAKDAATLADIWVAMNSRWNKDSKRAIQHWWMEADGFTFNQHSPVPGIKDTWVSSPTTLPCVVIKAGKRSRFTA